MRNCPRCLSHLKEARGPLVVIDMCTECGGAYFDHTELAKLARKQAEDFRKLENLVKPERKPAPASHVDDIPCPGCGLTMERYEYAYCSGIMLDRCPGCSGIWVDEGELSGITRHLRGGDSVASEDCSRAAQYLATDRGDSGVGALAGMLARDER